MKLIISFLPSVSIIKWVNYFSTVRGATVSLCATPSIYLGPLSAPGTEKQQIKQTGLDTHVSRYG